MIELRNPIFSVMTPDNFFFFKQFLKLPSFEQKEGKKSVTAIQKYLKNAGYPLTSVLRVLKGNQGYIGVKIKSPHISSVLIKTRRGRNR